MQHSKLIERLGGYRVLAEKLGRHPSSVCRWQENGIPPAFWQDVSELAREAGIRGASVEMLRRDSPRYGAAKEPEPAPVS